MKALKRRKKICLAASSGGHYEQLMMLKPLLKDYDGFVLTERTAYMADSNNLRTYHIFQVNRKEIAFIPKMFINTLMSMMLYIKERPNVVICTGVLAMIPMCLIIKIFGGKLIYIESFAKSTSPTITGKLLYRFSDRFYVQWPKMLEFYPGAVCLGGIY